MQVWFGVQKHKSTFALLCRQHAITGEFVGAFGYCSERWPKISSAP
jgi:hypothetical protein